MRTGLGSDDADDGDKKERDRRTTDMAFEIKKVSIRPYQVEGERVGSGSRARSLIDSRSDGTNHRSGMSSERRQL